MTNKDSAAPDFFIPKFQSFRGPTGHFRGGPENRPLKKEKKNDLVQRNVIIVHGIGWLSSTEKNSEIGECRKFALSALTRTASQNFE